MVTHVKNPGTAQARAGEDGVRSGNKNGGSGSVYRGRLIKHARDDLWQERAGADGGSDAIAGCGVHPTIPPFSDEG